jgi:hypothetical protein
MEDLTVDIHLPQYRLDGEEVAFVKDKDVILTRDLEDPEILIMDLGKDLGEVYFKVTDLAYAMRLLEWH